MNSILSRYLAAQFVLPFCLSTFFFVMFLLTFQMLKVMTLVINKGVDVSIIFELTGHIAVTFLPLAFPLAALFATLYCLGKLSDDSEVVAMRSFGLDKKKLLVPFMVTGIAMSLLCYSLNTEIIPYSKTEFKRILTFLTSKGFLANIKAGEFFTQIPGVTLFSEEVADDGKDLLKVFIYTEPKSIDGPKRVIFAEKGRVTRENNLENGETSLRLLLTQGNILRMDAKNQVLEKILFDDYDFPIMANNLSGNVVTKDSMRSSNELWKRMHLSDEERKEFDIGERSKARTQIEFWNRINTPFLCLVFIFLGFGLGIKNARGKRRNTSSLTLMILVTHYTLFFTGISFAKKGVYPPLLAVFFPTVIGLGLATYYFRKLDWID